MSDNKCLDEAAEKFIHHLKQQAEKVDNLRPFEVHRGLGSALPKPKTYKMKINCYNCGHSGYEVEIPWGVWASKYPVPCPKCGCTPDNGGVPR